MHFCILPLCMIYPRKKKVPENMREGAISDTLFCNSDNSSYLEWFKFFLRSIPPAKPVLLIQDGHTSHISIEFMELTCANDACVLCLPAHTTHLLQPLDVGAFKSLKAYFSKAWISYLSHHPSCNHQWYDCITSLDRLSQCIYAKQHHGRF